MTRDIDDTDREYAFQELPVRYVVKCSDDRVVPNPEEGSGVSRHRFYHAAADAARSRSRAEDLVFAVWDVEAGKFVTGPVTDVFSRDDFGCPVCGDEYDGRLEGGSSRTITKKRTQTGTLTIRSADRCGLGHAKSPAKTIRGHPTTGRRTRRATGNSGGSP
ncbi:hypothetical protein ACFQH8_16035 [Halomicroarcula sp. GCM10025710]